MVSIDEIIKDIDKELENQQDIDPYDWVLEAKEFAEGSTREVINNRCRTFAGVSLKIPSVFGVKCNCTEKYTQAFAQEIDEGYGWGIFQRCLTCDKVSEYPIPFEMLGKERVIASLAVCMKEKIDGY